MDPDFKKIIMNWGKGITIAIVLFMGFIISFVVRAFNRDSDLISDNYYEEGLAYFFDGMIDKVSIWNEALNIEKIQADMYSDLTYNEEAR